MKKTLSIILALSMILASVLLLSSCKDEETPVEQFVKVANSVKAYKVVSIVDCSEPSGDKLGGIYSTEIEGNNSISTYSFTTYRTIEDGADNFVSGEAPSRFKVLEGTAYYKDGKLSYDGDTWTTGDPIAVYIDLNLNADYLTDAVLSEDSSTLTATLTSENAKKVLGTDLNVEGVISLTVRVGASRLTEVSVSCTTKSGNVMSVRTSYSYSPVTLVFPEAE